MQLSQKNQTLKGVSVSETGKSILQDNNAFHCLGRAASSRGINNVIVCQTPEDFHKAMNSIHLGGASSIEMPHLLILSYWQHLDTKLSQRILWYVFHHLNKMQLAKPGVICFSFIPVLRSEKQVELWVWDQPGLHGEFYDSQATSKDPIAKQKQKQKQLIWLSHHLPYARIRFTTHPFSVVLHCPSGKTSSIISLPAMRVILSWKPGVLS